MRSAFWTLTYKPGSGYLSRIVFVSEMLAWQRSRSLPRRKTDAIRRKGENISAMELELVIDQLPGVHESAAIAVPSNIGEDDVMIVVQPEAGSRVDPAKLHAELQRLVPRFMVPQYIRIVPELPRTLTNKVQKQALRDDGITTDTWSQVT
jgi:crotonobetaine/carnitine-CoA ligase